VAKSDWTVHGVGKELLGPRRREFIENEVDAPVYCTGTEGGAGGTVAPATETSFDVDCSMKTSA